MSGYPGEKPAHGFAPSASHLTGISPDATIPVSEKWVLESGKRSQKNEEIALSWHGSSTHHL